MNERYPKPCSPCLGVLCQVGNRSSQANLRPRCLRRNKPALASFDENQFDHLYLLLQGGFDLTVLPSVELPF